MPATCWDPERLLNINVSGRRVTCVGQKTNKHTGPCSFKPPNAETSGFRQVVQCLSKTPPEYVTFSDLSELARLSLCRAYHSGQSNMIARRWQETIKTAIFHKNSISASSAPSPMAIRRVAGLIEKAASEAAEHFEAYASMKKDLEGKDMLLEEYSGEIYNLRARIQLVTATQQATTSKLQTTVKACQDEQKARSHCESKIINLRSQLSSSQEQALLKEKALSDKLVEKTAQVKGLQADMDQARHENQQLEAHVADGHASQNLLRQSIERLRSEAVVAAEREQQLQKTLEKREAELQRSFEEKEAQLRRTFEEREEQLQKTLEEKEEAFRGCHAALGEQKSLVLDLGRRVSDLGIINCSLERSITQCWLHRVKARITSRKSKSPLAEGG